jgi:hypothetical protein
MTTSNSRKLTRAAGLLLASRRIPSDGVFSGTEVERLNFKVYKSLNSYRELMDNPEKYQDALERWFGPAKSA